MAGELLTGPVVCGVDESRAAARAAQLAGRLAAELGAPAMLVHAAAPTYVPGQRLADRHEQIQRQASLDRAGYTETVLAPIDVGENVPVERTLEFGEADEVLRTVAGRVGAALVVIGFKGLSALEDALLGSTTSALVRDCPSPVVLSPDLVSRIPGEAVVCGVDGSPGATAAAVYALELADRLGVRLLLCHVDDGDGEESALDTALAAVRTRAGDTSVDGLLRQGQVAEELIEVARESDAGIVAVGSRGRGAFKSALLGSVSRRLLQRADRPVMVVSPRAAASAGPGDA